MKINKFLILIYFLSQSCLADIVERPDWNTYFENIGTSGTFLLFDLNKDILQVSDLQRAKKQYMPASTYKIPHTLIALETGVVTDEKQIFKWDGNKHKYASWNKDHNLGSALKHSVIPIYQKFAVQIGTERMEQFVKKMSYGNTNINGKPNSFWLDGELKISPIEQIEFLVKLYKEELPFSKRNQKIVKSVLENESTSLYSIYAKTGFASRVSPAIGWWVGWLEQGENSYFFVLNMDVKHPGQIASRTGIPKAIMKAEKLL